MPPPIAYNDTAYVSPAIFTLSSATNAVNWYTDTHIITLLSELIHPMVHMTYDCARAVSTRVCKSYPKGNFQIELAFKI